MSVSPKGWLALLISVALHGIGIGLFCWLSSRNHARVIRTDLVNAQTEPSITAWVMGERTEVMSFSPQTKPNMPTKTNDPPKPTGPSSPPNAPGAIPEAIKSQANPIENPGIAPGGQGGTAPGSGPIATTTFFEVPTRGRRIVYLIDHSASMGPSGALEVAGQELLASLQRLPAGTYFQIIVYNRTADVLMPRFSDWLEAHQQSIQQVAAAWNNLPAEGGTDHVRALKLALARQADVVFFLTDAGDVRADSLREITRLNHGRTAIDVIQLNAGRGQHDGGPLQLLAKENRGTFQSVLLR